MTDIRGVLAEYTRKVTTDDIHTFAHVSGDFSPNHTSADYMRETPYGKPIAHGALTLAYTSGCSTRLVEKLELGTVVSYGYDKLRFMNPVYADDTVRIQYRVDDYDPDSGRITTGVQGWNQHGDVVVAATHILKCVG